MGPDVVAGRMTDAAVADEDEEEIECGLCGRTFESEDDLEEHLLDAGILK